MQCQNDILLGWFGNALTYQMDACDNTNDQFALISQPVTPGASGSTAHTTPAPHIDMQAARTDRYCAMVQRTDGV